jgi:hypothetical protein
MNAFELWSQTAFMQQRQKKQHRSYFTMQYNFLFRKADYTRAIWKVTSSEQLTKQAIRKQILCTKKYIHTKLLLNIVTTGIEALVVSGTKFQYDVPRSRKCGSIHPLPHMPSWGSA